MKKICVIFPLIVMMCGCTLLNRNKDLRVVLKLKREKLDQSSVLIFNFKEPQYAEGSGAFVGELFHIHLLKSKKFKVVSLYTNSPWSRIGETEEERLMNAVEEGRSQDFDYMMVGELRDFYYGGINKTRVKIKVRIIEVKTRTTIFLADNYKEDTGKDPSYPMNTRLSKKSLAPKALAEKIIKELIKKI